MNLFRPSTGIPVLHSGSHFRHGLLQLMIHTIDPLHDGNLFKLYIKKKNKYNFLIFFTGKVDEKATQLHAIASLKVNISIFKNL